VIHCWLKYWIIFLCFSYCHDAVTLALNLSHFPYWYQLKLAVIYWLQLPITAGAERLYERIVKPVIKRIGLTEINHHNTNGALDIKIKQE